MCENTELRAEIDRLRAGVETLIDDQCWVTKAHHETLSCSQLIGGYIAPDGGPWTAEMCCLPCRFRALLAIGETK